MHTPVQIEVTAGRFRDNRRGVLEVRQTSGDMAEVVLHQPGHFDQPPTTTRIVLAGAHLVDVAAQLREVADQLEAAMVDTGVVAS